MIQTKIIFFIKHQNKAEFKNLDDSLDVSAVIFLALEPLQSQWPQQPQWPQWPQWPRQPQSIKTFTDPDGWIIPDTQMTNTSPFLWNESSKFQFFTDIWYLSVDVTFSKTDHWNSNFQTPWTRYGPLFNKINDPSTLHSHLI